MSALIRQLLATAQDDDDLEAVITELLYPPSPIYENIPRRLRLPNTFRDRLGGHERLMRDYFAPAPTYGPLLFRRRFGMSKEMFLGICTRLEAHDPYWTQRRDCTGLLGLSTIQKVAAAIHQLAYGAPAGATDEYICIGESTSMQALKRFTRAVAEIYAAEYLRAPNATELRTIFEENDARGFPGCKGSIDGIHWVWKNSPQAWAGQYEGKKKTTTVVLEAVASQNLRIWRACFGTPGALNDLSVLHSSPVSEGVVNSHEDRVQYSVMGEPYDLAYYLANATYPSWAVFVKKTQHAQSDADRHFATCQEAAHKDIERAFGALQARWAIVAGPCRLWQRVDVGDIMRCCIILHNMMVVESQDDLSPGTAEGDNLPQLFPQEPQENVAADFALRQANHRRVRDELTHHRLTQGLKDLDWLRRSQEQGYGGAPHTDGVSQG